MAEDRARSMTALHHLALALAALAVAPLLYRLGRAHRTLLALLDGFVLAGVSGLVLIHVLPHTLEEAGPAALVAAVGGLLIPYAAERLGHEAQRFTTPAALVGLGLHALMDGGGLAGGGHGGEHQPLATAIVLHRLPVGMLIWWLVAPRFGWRIAALILLGVGGATTVGFFSADALEHLGAPAFALFEAAVAGMLTHVLVEHGPLTDGPDARHPLAETLGAAVGVAGLAWLPVPPAEAPGSFTHELLFSQAFLHLALDAAPALLAGYALAGAAVGVLSPPDRAWLDRGGALGRALKGLGFAVPRPICSCEVLPEFEGQQDAGIRGPGPLAFLLGAPGLRLEAVPLSAALLGLPFTVVRFVSSALLGAGAALLLDRLVRPASHPAQHEHDQHEHDHHEHEHDHHEHDQHEHEHDHRHDPTPGRLACALRFGALEVVGHTAAWVVMGLGAAALLNADQVSAWLAAVPPDLDVPLFALLGLPLYVCASGATPLTAALIFAGVSPGAALAFLLTGPAHDVATAVAVRRRFGGRAALAFGAVVVIGASGLGTLANVALGPADLPLLHGGDEPAHGVLSWASLAAVTLLFAAALLRHGPRRLLKTIISGAPGAHEHHHHGHEHG
ncbi:MAG: permease [Deltaproteobacteria bacterium]|nr:permease [Deltaproteobacteria bacterium]